MGQPRGLTPESSTIRPDQPATAGRMISLCLHAPPGAPTHLDLFLAPPHTTFGDEERVLETWRMPRDPRVLPEGSSMDIEPLGLHRGLYARLRGPKELSGGRGLVTPLAHGSCTEEVQEEGRRFQIHWSDGECTCILLQPIASRTGPVEIGQIRLTRATAVPNS